MISRLLVENFKALRLLDVEFGRFTLIIGPNDSGKSSLLRALSSTCELAKMRSPELPASCLSSGASSGVMLRVENDHASRTWVIEPGAAPECIELGDEHELLALDQLALYRLRYTQLVRPSVRKQPNPRLGCEGEGLAELLDALRSVEGPRFEALEGALRAMVPGLRSVQSQRCAVQVFGGETLPARSVALDYEHAQGIPAHEASEGVMLALGLLAAAESAPPRGTLLIDDLDRGLDSRSALLLVSRLRAICAARPDIQIIATSRSPALADECQPDQLLAMTRAASGDCCVVAHPVSG